MVDAYIKKKLADSNLIVHAMGWESLQRRSILFGVLGRPRWASAATSVQRLKQQLLTELHIHSSEGTAAAFVCFCSSLNKWLIRNWAKNDTQHKTGRCLVLLKGARDMVRGKGDAIGGNIVSLERFGFSAPWKMSLRLYHGKLFFFWGGGRGQHQEEKN